MKTFVILSHPNFAASRVNKALSQVAKGAAGVEVRHLEGLYGTDTTRIDARAEQDALRGADRIVFLYPMYWLNVPPMLKLISTSSFRTSWWAPAHLRARSCSSC